MIALRLSNPPFGKRRGVKADRMFSRKRLARANGVTFKELALVLLQFQKNLKHSLKKQHGDGADSPEHTFVPAGEHSTGFL